MRPVQAVDVPSKSYTMVVLPSARKPKPKDELQQDCSEFARWDAVLDGQIDDLQEQLKKPTVGPVGVMHNESSAQFECCLCWSVASQITQSGLA
eukprot:2912882-Amphidinium_carterae.1